MNQNTPPPDKNIPDVLWDYSGIANRLDVIAETMQRMQVEMTLLAAELRGEVPRIKEAKGGYGTVIYPDGSTPGLRRHILRVLSEWPTSLTSAEIAKELYRVHPKVSTDLFKRRVIVAVSAMHTDEHKLVIPDPERQGKGREIYWKINPEMQREAERWANLEDESSLS